MNKILVASLALILLPVVASAQYRIVDLGTLGGPNSFALDVNSLGQVSGNSSKTAGASNPLNAFLYSGGAMANLGVVPGTGSNNFSRGYALNDAGVVVGESDNNASKVFVYQNGAISQLPGLVSATSSAVAHDVNNAGQIVGISSNGTASRPVMWSPSGSAYGTPVDLGTIDGLGGGRAWSVNASGVAAGLSHSASGTSHATMWADGAVVDLDAAANRFGQAYAVNASRVAVGSATVGSLPSGTDITRAIRWANGGAATLGILAGYTHSEAKELNDLGLAVGDLQTIAGSPALAVLWGLDGSAVDLNSFSSHELGMATQIGRGHQRPGRYRGLRHPQRRDPRVPAPGHAGARLPRRTGHRDARGDLPTPAHLSPWTSSPARSPPPSARGWAPPWTRSRQRLHLMVWLAAGAMLAVVLFDVFPEAYEAIGGAALPTPP